MMELPKPVLYVVAFVAIVFIGNLLLLDLFLVGQNNNLIDLQTRLTQLSDTVVTIGGRTPTANTAQKTLIPPVVTNDSCPATCLSAITNATRSAIVRQALSPVTTAPTSPITTTSQKGEFFINLGTGSVLNSEASGSNWKTIDAAQATFDAGNYGSIKSAALEVFMHVQSGGEVHARLFDTTTPSIFWGADLFTTSGSSYFISGPITLSSGSKTYKVQMYSTLSTGYLDQARIHIVTQ